MFSSINPLYELIQEKTGETGSGLGYAATYAWIYALVVLLLVGFVFLLFRDKKPKDIKARQKQEKKLKAGKTAEEKIKFSEETSGKGGKVIWQIKITVQED